LDTAPIVTMRNITKRFGGTLALDNVDLDVCTSEVHSLVGVNGAGKSTLMKILIGACQPDRGKIAIGGNEVVFKNPIDALNSGICMVFQELNLFNKMTIAENILFGHFPMKGGFIDYKEGNRIVKEFLASMDIHFDPKMKVEKLNLARKQLIEIAKGAYSKPKILILDEPSSSLAYEEAQILYRLIHNLKEKGLAIIFITHKMEEILGESDRISILCDGKNVATGPTKSFNIDKVTGYMLGKDISIFEKKDLAYNTVQKPIALSVRNISVKGLLSDVSFELYENEILAITGLVGSGKSELGRTIFGIYNKNKGKITLGNNEIKIKKPRDAIKNKIGYMTISRKEEGIFNNFSVKKNITISILRKLAFFIKKRHENEISGGLINMLHVKCSSINQIIGGLSGGNQQKIVLGRWLVKKQNILILDEPTRGIDVGAKQEIYNILKQLVNEGISIVLISSEFEEILTVADRVLVMREGRIIVDLDSRETNRNELLRYAMVGA